MDWADPHHRFCGHGTPRASKGLFFTLASLACALETHPNPVFVWVQKKAAGRGGKKKRKAASAPDGGKVKSGKKGKPISLPTAAEVAAAAGTPQETQMELTQRQEEDLLKLHAKELKEAEAKGLVPMVPAAKYVPADWAIRQGYTCMDFSLGGPGASHFGLNKQRPQVNLMLYSGLNNRRLSSSGVKADFRRWQVVFPKPAMLALIPEGLRLPSEVRWVILWIALIEDGATGSHVKEPFILIAPFARICKTRNGVELFVLAVRPQHITGEKYVCPRSVRHVTHPSFIHPCLI